MGLAILLSAKSCSDCRESGDYILSTCLDQFCWATPADFPFFNDCTAASTSLRMMGWSSSVSVWVQFSADGSPLALWLYSYEQ